MGLLSIELRPMEADLKTTYPFDLPCIKSLNRLVFGKQITFFIGENGRGKSTLLEAIAIGLGFNAEGGTRNFRFATRATHSSLHSKLRLARDEKLLSEGFFFRSESFYNLASEIDRLDEEPGGSPYIRNSYGHKSLHAQSRGESILALAMHRFTEKGMYLLDEPEGGLSITSQITLMHRIRDLTTSGAQFIVATHSPFLLALPDALIYSFDGDSIEPIEYEVTTHFLLAKRFLSDHDSFFITSP